MKTVFITGASSGIGNATARLFYEKGWNVFATMPNTDAVHGLSAGERLRIEKLDVTKPQDIREAVKAAIITYGSIDVLVNNAGYGLLGPLESIQHDALEKQFATNVVGLMDVTREVLPYMRERKSGVIVNVSSMMGKISFPFFAPYVASKWAVEGFSETLQIEVKPFGIRVRLVEPGAIKTRFFFDAIASPREDGPYAEAWAAVWKSASGRGGSGGNPNMAAEVIYRAATSTSRKMRYAVDPLSKLLPFLRSISPLSLYHFILSKTVR